MQWSESEAFLHCQPGRGCRSQFSGMGGATSVLAEKSRESRLKPSVIRFHPRQSGGGASRPPAPLARRAAPAPPAAVAAAAGRRHRHRHLPLIGAGQRCRRRSSSRCSPSLGLAAAAGSHSGCTQSPQRPCTGAASTLPGCWDCRCARRRPAGAGQRTAGQGKDHHESSTFAMYTHLKPGRMQPSTAKGRLP